MNGSISLAQLPCPPSGRSGWPWTEECPSLPETMPDGSVWPRVSIVTPSYNQGQFIEETIRSVLLQGYPNLECMVMDGGSKDNSIDVIRKYEPWLTHWVSQPDRGTPHAINNGWAMATGRFWAWINSDDVYLPQAIATAVKALVSKPSHKLVYGSALFTTADGNPLVVYPGRPLRHGYDRLRYWDGWPIPQPTMFFNRELVATYGALDENFKVCVDYEWLVRVSKYEKFTCIPEVLATYRIHSASKTGNKIGMSAAMWSDCRRINQKHAPLWDPRSWAIRTAELWFYAKPYLKNIRSKLRFYNTK